MPPRRNPFARLLLAGLPVAFTRCTALLPLPLGRFIGKSAGRLAYCLVPKLRRIGLANLDLAYGDTLSAREKRSILRGAVENLGIVAAEFGYIPRLGTEDFDKRIRIEGAEHLDLENAFTIISAHFGNWEWVPACIRRLGKEMAVVYRPLDDPALDNAINRVRCSGGVLTVPKADAGRELLRCVKDGWVAGVLIDQSPRENAVPINFFGAPTWGTIAPVMLAVRAKVPVHPACCVRGADGIYTFKIHPAIELNRAKRLRENLVENSQRCQDAIESMIREHPEQWLWFHRRWKPRERLDEEWQAKLDRDKKR